MAKRSLKMKMAKAHALNGELLDPEAEAPPVRYRPPADTCAPNMKLALNSVEGVRISMSKITRYAIQGKLDQDAARGFLWMLEKIITALRAEAEADVILRRISELEKAAANHDIADVLAELRNRIM